MKNFRIRETPLVGLSYRIIKGTVHQIHKESRVDLERFNHFGKVIEFDPASGLCREINVTNTKRISGIGDLLGDSCVALVGNGNGLDLYLGQNAFGIEDPSIELHYEHMDDGTTVFSVRDTVKAAQVRYPSWWTVSSPGGVAFGTSNDEDEDICAYIIYMLKADTRKAHLIKKYA